MTKKKRTPKLRVAPEFAGQSVAAALARKGAGPTADQAPDQSIAQIQADQAPANTDAQDWVVFGVDTVAQMAAESAARKAGQSLGQWLSQLIADVARDAGPEK
jgi:hypothetical protein